LSGSIDRLTEAEIEQALAEGSEGVVPLQEGLVRAAVLIPFFSGDNGWNLLFTRRTEHVETHKGQVAFPGGTANRTDLGPVETALRETFEETGISPHSVRVLGTMVEMPTVTNFRVTPVIGVIEWPVTLKLEEAEVSRVFSVPLVWLADPDNHEIRLYERQNGSKENVVFFKPYDGEIIWGVTGRMMVNLLDLLIKKAASGSPF
jgi:8-oxo-dGTP pyrophosphatase MutT (NUDIX family)